jgi:signal transduction histidine kinase
VTPLVREGTAVAVLIHRSGLLDDAELVEQVTSAARLALEHERLQASLRAQEDDLRASRARIVEAGDAERHRLERDLHDGAQQRLVGLLLGVRLMRTRLGSDAEPNAVGRLDEVVAELQRAVDELRELAHGIHPAVLSDEGLAAAIDALAERASTPVCIEAVPAERYPAPVEHAAYRVVADAFTAGATRVRALRRDTVLCVEVDTAAAPQDLVQLEDRVGALDGWIQVEGRPGGGVRLRSEIPCA